jgi:hypothetical protein
MPYALWPLLIKTKAFTPHLEDISSPACDPNLPDELPPDSQLIKKSAIGAILI